MTNLSILEAFGKVSGAYCYLLKDFHLESPEFMTPRLEAVKLIQQSRDQLLEKLDIHDQ